MRGTDPIKDRGMVPIKERKEKIDRAGISGDRLISGSFLTEAVAQGVAKAFVKLRGANVTKKGGAYT